MKNGHIDNISLWRNAAEHWQSNPDMWTTKIQPTFFIYLFLSFCFIETKKVRSDTLPTILKV